MQKKADKVLMTANSMSKINNNSSGFGGLVVSMLASGSRVRTRPKPLDFSGVRIILSMPSFGGEVKESVPRPSFTGCKRTQYFRKFRIC